jgi:hypothetical protein
MRKILLGTASALALGLFATSAMASGGEYFWNYGYGKSSTDNTAVAVGVQLNAVENDGDITIGSQSEQHTKDGASWSHYHGFKSFKSSDSNGEGKVFNSNTIDGSFGGAGLVNVNQNNGNNVSQDAQNTVAAILGCDCGDGVGNSHGSSDTDNVAVAVGLQASWVSNGYKADIVVDVADQSNTIKGSFVGFTGLVNVNQNNGNNVSQKAQNTVAAIIAK